MNFAEAAESVAYESEGLADLCDSTGASASVDWLSLEGIDAEALQRYAHEAIESLDPIALLDELPSIFLFGFVVGWATRRDRDQVRTTGGLSS